LINSSRIGQPPATRDWQTELDPDNTQDTYSVGPTVPQTYEVATSGVGHEFIGDPRSLPCKKPANTRKELSERRNLRGGFDSLKKSTLFGMVISTSYQLEIS
jgi:hypothetical protein